MPPNVIRVDNISKGYHIGAVQTPSRSLLGGMVQSLVRPIRRASKLLRGQQSGAADLDQRFWALRDISFDVQKGEVIGIIGRNGAGKSTLLKILSRITYPSAGRIDLYGRVGSLLEVGTGFHPELTGRENVYLNGAILGMDKAEIDRKFDEIVDFAGVERFIDTPVKHYSSGMQVRLAFGVAAHMEPEILVVDEVLAVGDIAFQKKSLGKMSDVAQAGRTVLFVSHNLATVQALCERGLFLQEGRLRYDGTVSEAINQYTQSVAETVQQTTLAERADRETGGDQFRMTGVTFLDAEMQHPTQTLITGQAVDIRLDFDVRDPDGLEEVHLTLSFFRTAGDFLFSCGSDAVREVGYSLPPGRGSVVCHVPRWPLNRGRVYFAVFCTAQQGIVDWVRNAGYIDTEAGDFYGLGKLPSHKHQGVYIDYAFHSAQSSVTDITGASPQTPASF